MVKTRVGQKIWGGDGLRRAIVDSKNPECGIFNAFPFESGANKVK